MVCNTVILWSEFYRVTHTTYADGLSCKTRYLCRQFTRSDTIADSFFANIFLCKATQTLHAGVISNCPEPHHFRVNLQPTEAKGTIYPGSPYYQATFNMTAYSQSTLTPVLTQSSQHHNHQLVLDKHTTVLRYNSYATHINYCHNWIPVDLACSAILNFFHKTLSTEK